MTFATHADFVLTNAQVYWDARHLNENLNQAMQSGATIDHSVGIVMATGSKSSQEAFQVLVRASQRENRKLREIAASIVAGQKDQRGLRTNSAGYTHGDSRRQRLGWPTPPRWSRQNKVVHPRELRETVPNLRRE